MSNLILPDLTREEAALFIRRLAAEHKIDITINSAALAAMGHLTTAWRDIKEARDIVAGLNLPLTEKLDSLFQGCLAAMSDVHHLLSPTDQIQEFQEQDT